MTIDPEKQILDDFRGRVKDLERSDGTLKRFLKARNNDPGEAEQMLRNTIEWRQLNNLDHAITWKCSKHIMDTFPIEYPGLDFENRIIIYGTTGTWPLREWIEAGREDEMLQYLYNRLEKLIKDVDKSSTSQFLLICDLENLNYWNCAHYDTVQLAMKVFRIFEAHYPERLAEALILNAPAVVNCVWPLLKPLVSKRTLAKLNFLGSNKAKIISALLERMPDSSLPLKYRPIVTKKADPY